MEEAQVHIALVIACLSLISTGVSVIVFFFKMRWELDNLKKENDKLFASLKEISALLIDTREKGSLPVESLDKRISKLDEKMEKISENFHQLRAEMQNSRISKTY